MSEQQMRPCPFCGGTDTHWTHCMEEAHIVCETCDITGPDFESFGEFGDGAERLWNARPIEDALLAACEAVSAAWEESWDCSRDPGHSRMIMPMDNLRAEIAKAKGATP